MLKDKKILYLGKTAWFEATEQQFIFEKLAAANLAIWINPFGRINDSLLPKITRLNGELTVYYPGMNFLGLPFLAGFNEKRRLFQIQLYLIERDFEPDLVWFDDPLTANSAQHYRKKGARAIYFACPGIRSLFDKVTINKLAEQADYMITTDQEIFKKINKNANAYLLDGSQYLSKAEKAALAKEDARGLSELLNDDDHPADDLVESAFLKLVSFNCEQLERIIKER